jgi:hypothetical protein
LHSLFSNFERAFKKGFFAYFDAPRASMDYITILQLCQSQQKLEYWSEKDPFSLVFFQYFH